MKRNVYEISTSFGATVTKYSWNSSLRAMMTLLKEYVNIHGGVWRVAEKEFNKKQFKHDYARFLWVEENKKMEPITIFIRRINERSETETN